MRHALNEQIKRVLTIITAAALAVTLWPAPAHAQGGSLVLYPGPAGVPQSSYYRLQIRTEGGTWQDLFAYWAKVNPRMAQYGALAYFDSDFSTRIELKVTYLAPWDITSVRIRPWSYGIPFTGSADLKTITFFLDRPCQVSVEFNQDTNHNLHLFANPLEVNPPQEGDPGVKYYGPGVHAINANLGLASNQTIYIAGGALVKGSINASSVRNVTIRGRGILDASGFTDSSPRLIRISDGSSINIEGIILTNAQQWQIVPTACDHVTITNVKEIASQVYSDGVDIVSCQNVTIDGMFIRCGDDCISIKASGSENNSDIVIQNCVLWGDLAHGILIGPEGNGGITERVTFRNNEILDVVSSECGYSCGALAICSGAGMTIRDIIFSDVRVDTMTMSNLINLFVEQNQFVSSPGQAIRNVLFKNITFNGDNASCANRILGYDASRTVDGVTFENLVVNGEPIRSAAAGNFNINQYAANIEFKVTATDLYEPHPAGAEPKLPGNVAERPGTQGCYDLHGRWLATGSVRPSGIYLVVPADGGPRLQKITVLVP